MLAMYAPDLVTVARHFTEILIALFNSFKIVE